MPDFSKHPAATAFQRTPPKASDLEALLSDPDECVASLAMEQLLAGDQCDKIIADNQDSTDVTLHKRIHQLTSIVEHQKLLKQFVFLFEQGKLDAWTGALLLDKLYDPRSSSRYLQDLSREFFAEFTPRGPTGLHQLVEFLVSRKFRVPRPPWLNIGYFLLGDVLEASQGVPALLCILARQLAQMHGFQLCICLHSGRFCLLDGSRNLSDPMDNWHLESRISSNQFHICTNQEILRVLISQILVTSAVVWEAYDVHHFAQLLQELDGIHGQPLPYPYGDYQQPDSPTPD